ncbi:anaerobic coproporphyrinogen III oxidase [Natranaerovirga hydrolytica]|uniref:Heme chaperone HemW n=1 Tax=Natranaerovirga hydrolytica TaxID=680378 RepID=A0A4R1N6X8_9FIRM|nr:radical SAM family heme chaperone HemW [Natranaerovirga hydrolytica]TCK98403.1 anaerobic coproporphyrinogen III oxidase [Natranaerovirga hydrolytica]
MKPLSLYIHLPFCKRKCYYCDFLSFEANPAKQEDYIKALIKEIKAYTDVLENYHIESIFMGGGTPSILSSANIEKIWHSINEKCHLSQTIESTIEINPGTVDKKKLQTYQDNGINRLSIGLQSTEDDLLKKIGRVHSYNEFLQTYWLARQMGFKNINIDLIFGLPNQSLRNWKDTLEKVVKLQPDHISAYSLIIEKDTPFYNLYQKGEVKDIEESLEREMYYVAQKTLKDAGYKQYETSNFAKEGFECYHNKAYWTDKEYLGLGLGASSYMNGVRQKNTESLTHYINQSFDLNEIIETKHIITKKEHMEEYMFLGLRLIKGVSKKEFETTFNVSIEAIYGDVLNNLEKEQFIRHDKDQVCLTQKGIDLSNYVLSEFLLE